MKMLAGGVAALFGEILTPVYLAGRVFRNATAYAPDGSISRAESTEACRVQVDRATDQMVSTDDYTGDDRALIVLRDSYSGPFDTDCEIAIDEGPYAGTRWRVAAPIDSDPAGSYWRGRGVLQKGQA